MHLQVVTVFLQCQCESYGEKVARNFAYTACIVKLEKPKATHASVDNTFTTMCGDANPRVNL